MSSEDFHTSSMLRTAYHLLKSCHLSVFWIGLTMVAIPECFSTLMLSLHSMEVGSMLKTITEQATAQPLHYEMFIAPIRPFLSAVFFLSTVQAFLLFFAYLAISHIALRKARDLPIHIPQILASVQKQPFQLVKIFLFTCIAKFIETLFQIPFQILSVMLAIGITWIVVEPTGSPIRQLMGAISFQYSNKISKFRVFMVHIVFGAFLFSGHALLHYSIQGLITADHWIGISKDIWLLCVGNTSITYIWCLTRLIQIAIETALFCYVPFFALTLLHMTLHTPLLPDELKA